MKTETEQIQYLLQTSITQYTEIVQLIEEIAHPKRSLSIAEISVIGMKILDKQKAATAIDKKFLTLLPEALSNTTIDSKNTIRTGLLRQVVQLNHAITPKLVNIYSLMDSELQHLKKGRSAMHGYQRSAGKSGRNLNNTL
jgi:predicted RNA-binding protein